MLFGAGAFDDCFGELSMAMMCDEDLQNKTQQESVCGGGQVGGGGQ